MVSLPSPHANFLRTAVEAVRSRSKALRHKFREVGVEHRFDDTQSPPLEMIEVTLRRGRGERSPKIRLILWEDRWAVVDAREGGKTGWKWFYNFQGRLPTNRAAEIVNDVESFDALLSDDPKNVDPVCISQFWEGKLLKGPDRIVKHS